MTLANRLTFIRLTMAPVYFGLFWIDKSSGKPFTTLLITTILIVLVTIAEITDAVDGALARSRLEVSDFGKLFDPFADYVSRFTLFFGFWWLELVPAYMVVIIFYREAIISFLRLLMRGENIVLAARRSGKIKAVAQATAIFIVLVSRWLSYWFPAFPYLQINWTVMLIVVVITLYSMFDYIHSCRHTLREIQK
ncbi:CDP-alcohol phosphatidyltransferase family protein [bacterium]|nr:CDP-alcohol phosphatidyltransferase family protein [candidate division CSSED10-310 bacterium]